MAMFNSGLGNSGSFGASRDALYNTNSSPAVSNQQLGINAENAGLKQDLMKSQTNYYNNQALKNPVILDTPQNTSTTPNVRGIDEKSGAYSNPTGGVIKRGSSYSDAMAPAMAPATNTQVSNSFLGNSLYDDMFSNVFNNSSTLSIPS